MSNPSPYRLANSGQGSLTVPLSRLSCSSAELMSALTLSSVWALLSGLPLSLFPCPGCCGGDLTTLNTYLQLGQHTFWNNSLGSFPSSSDLRWVETTGVLGMGLREEAVVYGLR